MVDVGGPPDAVFVAEPVEPVIGQVFSEKNQHERPPLKAYFYQTILCGPSKGCGDDNDRDKSDDEISQSHCKTGQGIAHFVTDAIAQPGPYYLGANQGNKKGQRRNNRVGKGHSRFH